jgi:DNA-directed RNA polymerase subunit F
MREFDKIMEFFSLSAKERDARLKDVFEESIEYFERFRHIMVNGSSEEKQQALEEIAKLREKVEQESKKIQEQTGMSEEDLRQFVQDPKHFNGGQWDALQEAKEKISTGVDTLKKEIRGSGAEDDASQAKKKKKKTGKKSKRISS